MTATITGPLSARKRSPSFKPQADVSNILILGSTGFIGNAILGRFQKEKGLRVRGLASKDLDLRAPETWRRLLEEIDQNTTLIVAARSRRPTQSLEFAAEDIAFAVTIGRALSHIKIRKCIYFSTAGVYGDHKTNLAITEKTPTQPVNLYELTKLMDERILETACKEHDIPLLIMRPSMVYGPGNAANAYGPTQFIRSIARENKVSLFGDGSESRPYLFIRDLAEITLRLARSEADGIYNVAPPETHTFQEILKDLQKILGSKFQITHVKRDRPKASLHIKPRKLLSVIKGFRFTPLKEGLKAACALDVKSDNMVTRRRLNS